MSDLEYTPMGNSSPTFNLVDEDGKFLLQHAFHLKVTNEALDNVIRLCSLESLNSLDLRKVLVDALRGKHIGTLDEEFQVIVENLELTIKEKRLNANMFLFQVRTDDSEWSSYQKMNNKIKRSSIHPMWTLVLVDVS